jgi:hypothetical protein
MDPIMFEVIAIPVFDSSHPAVQSAISDAANGITSALNNRNLRHIMDKDSFEGHMAAHPRPWDPPRCPACRHPQQGSIRRENMLIDTALQDEILQFLRNAVGTTGATTCEIPGTVLYVQNAIPFDIQQKANEINRLKAQFATLATPPAVPAVYNDIITFDDFMSVPVFDVSHPAVQNAIRDAATGGATTALNNRTLRHLFDKDALEAHIATGRSWAPAKCPACRHPADGGIRREHLRIDTALQDEILGFLRTAVGAGGSTSGP